MPVSTAANYEGRRGPVLALAAALAVGAPAKLSSQVEVVTDCREPCSLEVRRLVTLGDSSGPGFVGVPSAVLRLRDGSWAVTDRYDRDRVKLFAPDGTFLRTIGREGEGPGEFKIAQFLTLLPGDSIEVFDLGQARASIFAPDWSFERVERTELSGPEMVRLGNGTRVFALKSNHPSRLGLPLHLLDEDGRYVRSFGAHPVIERVGNTDLFYRQLTPGKDGRLWAAHLLRYRLEEWSTDGTQFRALERTVDWFPPQADYSAVPRGGGAPTPGLLALHRDGRGRLWTLVTVPDDRWREGVGRDTDAWGRAVRTATDYNALFDTIVEVIDPDRGTVLGRARFDIRMQDFSDDGLIYGLGQHSNLEPLIELWQIQPPPEPERDPSGE